MCEFTHLCYLKCRHLVNLLPPDNAILKLKHNGLLTLILTSAAQNDLNPVDYAVWGALQEMVYHCRSFKCVQEKVQLSQHSNSCHNPNDRTMLIKQKFLIYIISKSMYNDGICFRNDRETGGSDHVIRRTSDVREESSGALASQLWGTGTHKLGSCLEFSSLCQQQLNVIILLPVQKWRNTLCLAFCWPTVLWVAPLLQDVVCLSVCL